MAATAVKIPRLSLLLLLLFAALTHETTSANSDDSRIRYVHDAKCPFFSSPTLTCNHPLLNITTAADVRTISWVFPDGSNVRTESVVDPLKYAFSAPDDIPATGNPGAWDLYSLTALEIDEDQFGYYLCLVEYNNDAGGNAKPVDVIRLGLNVDGADFSELLDSYRKNAIVGGAAAAAILVIVGGGCLFWNVRNGDRDQEGESEDEDDLKKPAQGSVQVTPVNSDANNEKRFDNAAYRGEDADSSFVDVHM